MGGFRQQIASVTLRQEVGEGVDRDGLVVRLGGRVKTRDSGSCTIIENTRQSYRSPKTLQ